MNYQVKISRSQLIQVLDILEYLEENNDRNRNDSVLYQDARGFWVGGPALANVACGGSEGLRRLRELRELGYVIEKRKAHPSHNYFSYRLVSDGA